jgi:hypothetical protein
VTIEIENPMQKPNWRWEKICRAIMGQDVIFEGDHWLYRGYQFWSTYNDESMNVADLTSRFSDVFYAYNLYMDTESDIRWAIEAFVMANSSPADIANWSNTSVSVITNYEKLFFDVRDKLHKPIYIKNFILAPFTRGAGTSHRDPDLFWKALGYYFGEDMLNAWMNYKECGNTEALEEFKEVVILKRTVGAWLNPYLPPEVVVAMDTKRHVAEKELGRFGPDKEEEIIFEKLLDAFRPTRMTSMPGAGIKRDAPRIAPIRQIGEAIEKSVKDENIIDAEFEELGKRNEDGP